MEEFFITPQNEKNAILLIDASGSVLQPYIELNENVQRSVFDKMQQICSQLPHENFRLVFWNSDNPKSNSTNVTPLYTSGIFKVPFAVPQSGLSVQFKIAKNEINSFCLTMPHLAFSQVSDWLQNGFARTIYFVTDGLIAWDSATAYEKQQLGAKLAQEIKNLIGKFRDIQLHIIAIERNSNVNYNNIESMLKVVGNDIFQTISDNRLTSMVASFTSVTPQHASGYKHINRGVQTPQGFIPYENRYFSPLDTPKFLKYITNVIKQNEKNEDALLKIVQNLSATISALIVDKPAQIKTQNVNMFCKMFEQTVLDASAMQFLLSRAVDAEAKGSAQLYAEYRSNLKNLYKDAGKMLSNNAAEAMMMENQCLTLPLAMKDGRSVIIVANSCDFSETIQNYAHGGYSYNGKKIAAIPFVLPYSGTMIKQCTRQWIRALLSHQYHLNVTSDEIIMIMMMINLQVQLALLNDTSALSKSVREAYQNLTNVMLEKMRLNSQKTEIQLLYEGNLFLPNDGNVQSFTRFMQNAASRLGVPSIEPLKLWYYLCLAHSQKLATSQFTHCQQFVKLDSTLADCGEWSLPNNTIFVHQKPERYDYTCLITMESTAATGGYRLLPHNTIANSTCNPCFVFSETGVNQLLALPQTSMCPCCYTTITRDIFAPVAKSGDENAVPLDVSLLCENKVENPTPVQVSQPASEPTSGLASQPVSASTGLSQSSTKPGVFVLLCGTVGCGKSTYAAELQKLEQAANKYCLITGTDKFVLQGVDRGAAAAQRVSQELQQAKMVAGDKVIILDTCGENFNSKNVFGVNFENWKIERVWVNLDRKQLDNYLAWSLYNVLNRQVGEGVLNPHSAGVSVCVDVHLRKAKSHFGKKLSEIVSASSKKEDILAQLIPKATAYSNYLNENREKFAPKAF